MLSLLCVQETWRSGIVTGESAGRRQRLVLAVIKATTGEKTFTTHWILSGKDLLFIGAGYAAVSECLTRGSPSLSPDFSIYPIWYAKFSRHHVSVKRTRSDPPPDLVIGIVWSRYPVQIFQYHYIERISTICEKKNLLTMHKKDYISTGIPAFFHPVNPPVRLAKGEYPCRIRRLAAMLPLKPTSQ